MSQSAFNFDQPIARKSDPEPSHAAAESVRPKLAGLRAEAYRRARVICDNGIGTATASEIGRLHEDVDDLARCESLRKRVRELVVAGYLIEAGERICRKTGSKVAAFKVRCGNVD